MSRIGELIAELKRRRVIRVAFIYATSVWVIIQLADIMFEAFEVENWVMQVLVAVSIAAFPAVVIASWFIDWNNDGLEVTDVQDVKRILEIQSDPSIAVLPFTDMSPERKYEYFGHGLAEEITVRLTRFDWLKVAARTSAFGMKSLEQDINIIGEKLSVSTVLDGTVQVVGDRLRVSVELMDVQRGLTLWAERFDGDMSDVFDIQDSLAGSVVATLGDQLNTDQPSTPKLQYEEPAQDAYNLYLTARYHYNKATPVERNIAAGLYARVIKLAPTYAPAYSGLAISRAVTLIGGSEMVSPQETMPPARDAAQRALELAPDSPEATGALAWIAMVYDWEFMKALNLFEKAVQSAPNANNLVGYGMCLNCADHLSSAVAVVEKAIEIEPLSLVALSGAARFYRYSERYDDARKVCEELLALDPTSKAAAINLFEISATEGDFDAARRAIAMEREFAGENDLGALFHEGRLAGYQRDLKTVKASRQRILEMAQIRYVPPFMIALLSLLSGELDEMYRWLDEGITKRDAFLIDLPKFRMPTVILEDPRYSALVERTGVVEYKNALAGEERNVV